jgi:hypothetical protein
MFGLPSFVNVTVTSDVAYNGLPSVLSLEFKSYVPFSDNYTIFITFPPEVRIPYPVQCLPHLMTSKVDCSNLPENKMKANLTFTNPPANPYDIFGFKVANIIN